MNASAAVFLIVAVALVAAQDYKAIVAQITQTCAAEHGITAEQIGVLRTTKNKNEIPASVDLKCFAKCAIQKSGFVTPGTGIDTERLVAVGVANGKNEELLRNGVTKCAKLYQGTERCEEYWDLYACFNSE